MERKGIDLLHLFVFLQETLKLETDLDPVCYLKVVETFVLYNVDLETWNDVLVMVADLKAADADIED